MTGIYQYSKTILKVNLLFYNSLQTEKLTINIAAIVIQSHLTKTENDIKKEFSIQKKLHISENNGYKLLFENYYIFCGVGFSEIKKIFCIT